MVTDFWLVIYWGCAIILFHVYFLYHVMLRLICRLRQLHPQRLEKYESSVSIIIAARNEEERIIPRIDNVLALVPLRSPPEIIVASDGSNDATVRRAQTRPGVRVLSFPRTRGKALTHNDAVQAAAGEIVVFTDADTQFAADFLIEILKPLADDGVGCVVGNLVYQTHGDAVSEAEGLYWRLEKDLRGAESQLGILATATGACMAVRKSLWRNLEAIDDSDFATPLDVILQGFKIAYAPSAVAYDEPPTSALSEFRTRVRQTSKNLTGTLRRWGFHGWLQHPAVSAGLVSHKLLRWFSPYISVGLFLANIALLSQHRFYRWTMAAQAAAYGLAAVGAYGSALGRRVPIASTAWSFLVAQAGMAGGVAVSAFSKPPTSFSSPKSVAYNPQQEAARIVAVYSGRDAQGKPAKYKRFLPEVNYQEFRKRQVWARALGRSVFDRLPEFEILDVGCGDGAFLRILIEWGATPTRLHGVDLLADRIHAARARTAGDVDFRCANAYPLGYDNRSMDLVTASTVFSSILDSDARLHLAKEMARVIKPGGLVMIYDYIISNPLNQDTIGIRAAEIRRLFAEFKLQRSFAVTLAPPLTRVLSSQLLWLAHALESTLPFLCTHRIFLLQECSAEDFRDRSQHDEQIREDVTAGAVLEVDGDFSRHHFLDVA